MQSSIKKRCTSSHQLHIIFSHISVLSKDKILYLGPLNPLVLYMFGKTGSAEKFCLIFEFFFQYLCTNQI